MTDTGTAEWSRARELVLAHGSHPSAYQVLNPGFRYWFSARGDAVAGYADHFGVRVVAGEPVASDARFVAAVAEFETATAHDGLRICYLAAESRLAAALAGRPEYDRIAIGAHPVLDPSAWPATIDRYASLRAQLHRARNKGVAVAEVRSAAAEADPRLRDCLADWLAARGLPPLHFLVEPETLDRLGDRRVFVATRAAAVVGFAVASPIPVTGGWLLEQLVRRPAAPNGTAESLVAAALDRLRLAGSPALALGVAPLSARAGRPEVRPLVAGALRWARAHGRRFYNFDGLERFKAKFRPAHWEPVYAIAREPAFSIRTLLAIAAAYCNGALLRTGLRAASQAFRQEVRWALHSAPSSRRNR
ncbi:MAG: phosphatidylglycerol lysyltransferase domain-containing protein [Gemmatimonadales bacterium]